MGLFILNSIFKIFEDCLKKFEKDIEGRSIKSVEVINLKKLVILLGEDFIVEMNVWYGVKELVNRWNGFFFFG